LEVRHSLVADWVFQTRESAWEILLDILVLTAECQLAKSASQLRPILNAVRIAQVEVLMAIVAIVMGAYLGVLLRAHL
jgi:formate-dependent nitrite reductase membrane component NrfD